MSKTICITGASSGIGKSIGDYLTDRGYRVIGSSRTPDKYPDSRFLLLPLDVQQKDSVQAFINQVLAHSPTIDVLINNAGIGITGPAEEIPDSEIHKVFETNFYGPIRMMKAVLPIMRAQQRGHIINITSIAGYMGLPYRSYYSASKAALEMLTEAMRMENKNFQIQLTNVAPGDFATNIAAGRYHHPLRQESAYYTDYKTTLDLINSHVQSGQDPIEMARLIYRIIQNPHPKVSYKVGSFLQKFSVFLKKNLPSRWYEKMLMNHYKIGK